MYTDPGFTRRGVGTLILALCEAAARAEGFSRLDLMATLAGEQLYRARGFEVVERHDHTVGDTAVPLVRMTRVIPTQASSSASQ